MLHFLDFWKMTLPRPRFQKTASFRPRFEQHWFVHMMNTTMILCDNQRGDSIIEESRIWWLLQQIDIRYCLIWNMVSRWARRLHRIETDVQVADILSKPQGEVKYVTFPNDLESLRDLLIRVLHFACIELWELWGAWGTYWSNIWPQGNSPSPSGALWTWWLVLLWARMISSPVAIVEHDD